MPGVFQTDLRRALDDRHRAVVSQREAGLGADEVHRRQKVARTANVRQVGPDRIREPRENAHDLAPLLVLQLLELVIDLDDLDRLDVNRLAGSRLVVDEPFDLSLVGGRDRNHGPSVADRDRGVGVDQTGSLRRTHDLQQPAGCLSLPLADRATDREQLGRGVVPDTSELVDDRVDVGDDRRKSAHVPAQFPEPGVLSVFPAAEKGDERVDRRESLAQRDDFLHVQKCAYDGGLFQERLRIDEAAVRESAFEHQRGPHLVGLLESAHDRVVVVAELGFGELVGRALRDAERLDLAFDAVEAYLAFEIVGVNHVFMNQR